MSKKAVGTSVSKAANKKRYVNAWLGTYKKKDVNAVSSKEAVR
jgi:hypothetical protein